MTFITTDPNTSYEDCSRMWPEISFTNIMWANGTVIMSGTGNALQMWPTPLNGKDEWPECVPYDTEFNGCLILFRDFDLTYKKSLNVNFITELEQVTDMVYNKSIVPNFISSISRDTNLLQNINRITDLKRNVNGPSNLGSNIAFTIDLETIGDAINLDGVLISTETPMKQLVSFKTDVKHIVSFETDLIHNPSFTVSMCSC